LSISCPAYDDSLGISRFAPRFVEELSLTPGAHLVVGGGPTYATQGSYVLTNPAFGARLHWRFGRLFVEGELAVFGEPELWAPALTLGLDPIGWAHLTLGAHRRPFIEVVDALATDEQAFSGSGVGGALRLASAAPLGVNEMGLAMSLTPGSWLSIYADGRAMTISDGNLGFTLATGLGFNTLGFLGASPAVRLFVRWDSYFLHSAGRGPDIPTIWVASGKRLGRGSCAGVKL
jgi:hypothetical protein